MSEQNGSVLTGNPGNTGNVEQSQNQQPGQWFDGFQDAQVKEWASTKGWKSPEAAVQSAWHLERLMGADKAGRGLVLPKDEADADGWNNVYNKLGRPAKPEEYGLSAGEGQDDSFLKAVLPKMHELGLTKKQAEGLANFNNEYLASYNEQQEVIQAQKATEQFESLQKEWGGKFDQYAETARRAVQYVGLSKEQGEAIEQALGVDVAAKMFKTFGEVFMEHASPGNFNTGGDSAASARAEIARLKLDVDFGRRLANGDSDATNKWNKLHAIASAS